eukprot:1771847-Lingulodinium_polyedra.AAC.1
MSFTRSEFTSSPVLRGIVYVCLSLLLSIADAVHVEQVGLTCGVYRQVASFRIMPPAGNKLISPAA